MKTTLDINDQLLAQAKSVAALQGATLTRLVEEGLALRLRTELPTARGKAPKLPVLKGRGGLASGINPLSNRSYYEAEEG